MNCSKTDVRGVSNGAQARQTSTFAFKRLELKGGHCILNVKLTNHAVLQVPYVQ
jgi:hypothetical protein